MFSSLVHFLGRGFWFEWSIYSSFAYLKEELFVYLEKEQPTFTGYHRIHPHVCYQWSSCLSWHPNLSSGSHVDLCFDLSFFMGSILWLYVTQKVFIIYAPDADTTENSYSSCSRKAGYFTPWEFSTSALVDDFHWSLSDSKSPQVSRILLNTLADLKNAVGWTVFTRFVISKSSSPCTNSSVTIPKTNIYNW